MERKTPDESTYLASFGQPLTLVMNLTLCLQLRVDFAQNPPKILFEPSCNRQRNNLWYLVRV